MQGYIPPTHFPEPQPQLFYAKTVYERIQEHIQTASNDTEQEGELVVFVPLTDGSRILVESFGYHNPGFIIVYGTDLATNNSVKALVSHTNIQLLISRVNGDQPVAPTPRRIGFRGSHTP